MRTKYIYTLLSVLFLGVLGGLSTVSAQVAPFYGYNSYYGQNYGQTSPYYGSNGTYYNSSYSYVSGCALYSYNAYTGVSSYLQDVCQSNAYNSYNNYNYQYVDPYVSSYQNTYTYPTQNYQNYQNYQTYQPTTYNNTGYANSYLYNSCSGGGYYNTGHYTYSYINGVWYPSTNQNCNNNNQSNSCYYQNGQIVCY